MLVAISPWPANYIALNGGPEFPFTEAISLQVRTEDQAETDRLWEALTANGGEESQCGWLKDRWGLSWQITPKRLLELIADPDKDRARRAMEAMLTMRKIDIARRTGGGGARQGTAGMFGIRFYPRRPTDLRASPALLTDRRDSRGTAFRARGRLGAWRSAPGGMARSRRCSQIGSDRRISRAVSAPSSLADITRMNSCGRRGEDGTRQPLSARAPDSKATGSADRGPDSVVIDEKIMLFRKAECEGDPPTARSIQAARAPRRRVAFGGWQAAGKCRIA